MFNNNKMYINCLTSICLRALSHSFCPGADTVQMLISWIMLSVTALKNTYTHNKYPIRSSRLRLRWGEVNWCFTPFFNHIWLYMAISFNSWRNKLFLGVNQQHSVSNWQLPVTGFEPQRVEGSLWPSGESILLRDYLPLSAVAQLTHKR